jgi:hypothetical protein
LRRDTAEQKAFKLSVAAPPDHDGVRVFIVGGVYARFRRITSRSCYLSLFTAP